MKEWQRHAWWQNLNDECYQLTSDENPKYNCVAWVLGIDKEWWWPAKGYRWLNSIPLEPTLTNFISFFEFEKVAIYCKDGYVEHVSKQKENGKWTSKLGQLDDITHDTCEQLEGYLYGNVVQYLKRVKI
jgi:hypothetical protein